MTEILSKQSPSILVAKEENFIDWVKVLEMLKKNFGADVYESWIKNVHLKKEYNHYVIYQLQLDLLEIG